MDNHSLSHTKWNCKYHIVFTPKYRFRQQFKLRQLLTQMLRQLGDMHILQWVASVFVIWKGNTKMNELKFPLRLVPGKSYLVYETPEGTLAVRLGPNGEDLRCLSETEQILLDYLCSLYRGESLPPPDVSRIDEGVLAALEPFGSLTEWFLSDSARSFQT